MVQMEVQAEAESWVLVQSSTQQEPAALEAQGQEVGLSLCHLVVRRFVIGRSSVSKSSFGHVVN